MGFRDQDESQEASTPVKKNARLAMVTIERPSAPGHPPSRRTSTDAPDKKPPPQPGPSRPPLANTEVPIDPNLTNPRLHVNRACIYERHLPGDAYITAHVQRLQHGSYSSRAVSDKDFDNVDFLGISFVFHSPNTQNHRFKAATIRASVRSTRDKSSAISPKPSSQTLRGSRSRNNNPRFLRHAPHLLYGAVSPETLQWNYSLAGQIGFADLPLMASIMPSGGMNGRYRRYEMMRIQGSVRSLRSPRGRQYDVEAGEIVWSLEENTLQRSGLPREFTFAMLIQKPRADSRICFSLDIDPVLQCWFGNYPSWMLSLPSYRAVPRRPVDFRVESGQRFEPATSERGFNFAQLESSFDDYVHMPGRKFASSISPDNLNDDNELPNNPLPNFNMVQPVHGMPQMPFTPGPGTIPGMTPVPGLPGKVGVGGNLAASSMPMPASNIDARPLSVRVLMEPSSPSPSTGRGDGRTEGEKMQVSTVNRTRRRSGR
ncbi:hypothetical protein P168DRAFT_325643 [Aspergillus campestris IBT 28561]|uniref:Uncharacterized protein n=1 Tax=Aspergillus campestris (strain IBT 28561) TaxID=1392248 RepID=A0A2I1DAD2_ASPC2|nr:uncharacterized protein P168DRAFT_325643 [Aspergillus campestris IBT 28561]PKY06823.1 hypothetical protein P168DRAFT_325643 [Aspergillus campestris IBT 28561]